MTNSIKDSESYRGADSGCKFATGYLGKQSSCLQCPFQLCVGDSGNHDRKRKGQEEVMLALKQGKTLKETANELGISTRTVSRRISGKR